MIESFPDKGLRRTNVSKWHTLDSRRARSILGGMELLNELAEALRLAEDHARLAEENAALVEENSKLRSQLAEAREETKARGREVPFSEGHEEWLAKNQVTLVYAWLPDGSFRLTATPRGRSKVQVFSRDPSLLPQVLEALCEE